MNFNRISKLSELLTNELKRKPTIILDPNPEKSYRVSGTVNDIVMAIDADDWEIPEELRSYVERLAREDINIEEKIMQIYQKLCNDYTYDDNVLSYIKKNDDESFFIPDQYGRETDSSWKENRSKHNRRNCFEISRILAKAIDEVIRLSGQSRNYDTCIAWDEANTHYFVGIASKEFYVSLDLDDFTQIKDLTRMKTGLTLDGIKILSDPHGKFEKVIKKINEGRSEFAKDHITAKAEEIRKKEKSDVESNYDLVEEDIEADDLKFIKYAVQILKEGYDLDSAGMYEYLKEIIDTKIGPKSRKKVWKEVENTPGVGIRYTRCLIVNIDGISYLIDVTRDDAKEIIRKFDKREFEDPNAKVIPFKKMKREWSSDPYDGR